MALVIEQVIEQFNHRSQNEPSEDWQVAEEFLWLQQDSFLTLAGSRLENQQH